MGWIIKGGRSSGRQKDRLVIIQLTTMSLHVIPLVAITPSDNANGGSDEDLRFEINDFLWNHCYHILEKQISLVAVLFCKLLCNKLHEGVTKSGWLIVMVSSGMYCAERNPCNDFDRN